MALHQPSKMHQELKETVLAKAILETYRDYEHLAEGYKLFSHPLRLKIVHLLSGGELSVQSMVKTLSVSDVTLAQHIARLRRSRIIESRREGTAVQYRLRDPQVVALCRGFEDFYSRTFI